MTTLEDRVTELEREMAEVRREQADAHTLASGAHQDVGDANASLRAHIDSLESLRTTQVEQGKDLRSLRTEMRQGFRDTEHRFTLLDFSLRTLGTDVTGVQQHVRGLETEMREGFAEVATRLDQLAELVTSVKKTDC